MMGFDEKEDDRIEYICRGCLMSSPCLLIRSAYDMVPTQCLSSSTLAQNWEVNRRMAG